VQMPSRQPERQLAPPEVKRRAAPGSDSFDVLVVRPTSGSIPSGAETGFRTLAKVIADCDAGGLAGTEPSQCLRLLELAEEERNA